MSIDLFIKVKCDSATFGLDIMNNEVCNRVCIDNLCDNTSTSTHWNLKRKYVGAFISGINNASMCTKSDGMKAIHHAKIFHDADILHARLHPAPYAEIDASNDECLVLGDNQFKSAHQLLHSMKYDNTSLGEDKAYDCKSDSTCETNSTSSTSSTKKIIIATSANQNQSTMRMTVQSIQIMTKTKIIMI